MLTIFKRDAKKNVYINDSIRYVKGGFIAPLANQSPIVTAAAPAGSYSVSPPVPLEASADAIHEIFQWTGSHGEEDNSAVAQALRVTVQDTIYRRALMNAPVLANHFFGQQQVAPAVAVSCLQPFRMCESLFLEPQQTIEFKFYNYSTAGASNFTFVGNKRKICTGAWDKPDVKKYITDARERKKIFQPYWLIPETYPVVIPASGSITVFMKVSKDIRVVLFNAMEQTSTATTASNPEMFNIQLFDGQTERPLQNQPIDRTSYFGHTSNFPGWLSTGWMLEPNSLVKLVYTNYESQAVTTFNTWHGVASLVSRLGY